LDPYNKNNKMFELKSFKIGKTKRLLSNIIDQYTKEIKIFTNYDINR